MQMDAKQEILTRLLPKTEQIVSYEEWDDGWFETGWWKGRLNENNKQRFIAKSIGGDDVVIDRATGLMWAADGDAAGCNSGGQSEWGRSDLRCLGIANTLVFAGFNDWRIPNIKELMSIIDYSLVDPIVDPILFPNTKSEYYWSSTTNANNTVEAWTVYFKYGNIIAIHKTVMAAYYMRCVRGEI